MNDRRVLGPDRWKQSRARGVLRQWFFDYLRSAFETDDGKAILADTLGGLLRGVAEIQTGSGSGEQPYPGLGTNDPTARPALRSDVILVTGRFRSGSTLLWNLFRNLDGVTSYYEPLNERRWFDPGMRGERVDGTHRGVEEYWREYHGLEELGALYREDWIRRGLLMDERAWDPALKRYVEVLIERAPGRPVLQFNRIDFRLPWLRRHFPNARIVHIYRHPRDQWCSTLMGDRGRFTKEMSVADFPPFDKFYLEMWVADLKYHFPFLDDRTIRHPYQQFYYLWKLSYLFGRRYADDSVRFEDLVDAPEETLTALLQAVGVERYDLGRLKGLIVRPALGSWAGYADDRWFRDHEAACEAVLADFLGALSEVACTR